MRSGKTILKIAIAACTLFAATGSASGASALQEKLSVEDEMVRLNDLFTDTGEAGEAIIMPAPAPGKRRQITSYELNQIAKKYELEWDRPAYLKRVYIRREGTHFADTDLKPIVLNQIRNLGVEADVNINIYGLKKGLYLPLGFDVDSIEFESFNLTERQDRFTGSIKVPTSEHNEDIIRLSGTIQEVRLIPVLNRLITPGEVIDLSDINWKRHPANRINRQAIVDANNIIGQTVRRALSANQLINKNDITMPIMIAKGTTVNVTLKSGPMTLTLKGRALDDGGKGDTIRVMNTKSNRSLEARIISPSQLVVETQQIIKVASR